MILNGKKMNENFQMHVFFKGHVQGVFFRALIKKCADDLNIKGFVRNKDDLSVEMQAIGTKENLEKLLEKIKNNPGKAILKDINIHFEKVNESFSSFEIKY
jgi:acylphosphatase